MANDEHVALLKQGVDAWNEWRRQDRGLRPDLSDADLRGADLYNADLFQADLRGADLARADLRGADLTRADLTGANLVQATLIMANLREADLREANLAEAFLAAVNLFDADLFQALLSKASLFEANLAEANLREANLAEVILGRTVFGNTRLTEVKGLDQCNHHGRSFIDFWTLQNSGPLPLAFLRGVGLPDNLIEYLPSFLHEAIRLYSCFISYSSKDQDFAERIYSDLQNKGVRCWFAPHDMPIGAKIIDALDEAIRLRDKVLLILSEGAIASDWVEGEVTRALDEERSRKQVVLFPVRLDDAVMQTSEGWARLLRGQRNIGDFSGWKEHDSYQKSFERLIPGQ